MLEIVVSNLTDQNKLALLNCQKFKKVIKKNRKYKLLDIAYPDSKKKAYYRTSEEMLKEIYIELVKKTDHHFIIYEL